MLYHLSLAADDPRHAANVIAELWSGRAYPFPPVIAGSWIAMAGDERRTAIEFYPRGTELREAPGDADAYGLLTGAARHGPTHAAIGTQLDVDAVFAIAEREGWPAKYRKRGGVFGVIELWMEGCQMIEVLTPEMQHEYRESVTMENWERFLEASGQVAALA